MAGTGRVRVAVVGVAAVLLLAGCGRRGGLEPPPDPSVAPVPAAADPGLNAIRRPRHVPVVPPDQPFVLDPLL